MNARIVLGVGAMGIFCLSPLLSGSTSGLPASAYGSGPMTTQGHQAQVPNPFTAQSELPHFAWGDFNGDGRADAFVVQPDGTGLLLRHTGSELAPVQSELGLDSLPLLTSVSWQDFDADGRPDLFALTLDGHGLLLQNRGAEGFVDVTALSGLELEGIREAQWIENANGGAHDLVTLGSKGAELHRNEGECQFTTISVESVAFGSFGTFGAIGEPAGSNPLGEETTTGIRSERTESTHAPRSGSRVPVTTHSVRLAPSSNHIAPRPAAVAPMVATFPCASSLVDQAGGACIEASSQPVLGAVYPLSQDFNINPLTNNIGVGITAPGAKLHVLTSDDDALFAIATGEYFGARIRTNATTRPALEVEGAVDAAHFLGDVHIGLKPGFPAVFQSRALLDLDGNDAARMSFLQGDGSNGVLIEAAEFTGDGAQIEMWNVSGVPTIQIDADGTTDGADMRFYTSTGMLTVHLESEEASGNGAQLALSMADGTNTFVLDAQAGSGAAEFAMFTTAGVETVEIRSEEVSGNGGQIVLRTADGTNTIILDAEYGAGGGGRIQTEVLEITGGADLVESFDVRGGCEPGTVVVIDCDRPGELAVSSAPYDSRVAGIVSGAGGIRPGLSMGQAGVASGNTQVALTGRVFVRCSSENGAIRPGDLLTTAATAGHAMRASDHERAFGAVIGKAMTALENGTGLVLVLVSLQ